MEKKYIHEARYKKGVSRKRRNAKTVISNLNTRVQINTLEQKQPIKTKKVKKKIKKRKSENKAANILICIILLILIAVISRLILKDENEPFIPFPFMENENEQVIKIGVITSQNLLDENTSNLVLNEINKYYKEMLLYINTDYSITYGGISEVVKVSNKEYVIRKSEDTKVTIDEIKSVIEKNKQDKNSIQYLKLTNIENISVINENTLNVKLKNEDPYFIYALELSYTRDNSVTNYVKDISSNENKIVLYRHKKADKQLPQKVVVTKYKDVYHAIDAYKAGDINVFVTNADNVQTLLGRYEYNIKSYRNGQNVFLFASPKSNIYSQKEVRQAITYSINREGIIYNLLKGKGVKIDLPYIYDESKYKYDIYAAENLLLTNGYVKSNNLYYKIENGKKTVLELKLIVNKNDELKVNIAKIVKNNLSALGIKVNLESLTESKLQKRIASGDYDLIIADVNLNDSPDITFLTNNLFVTEEIKQGIASVENSSVKDLSKNINNLQKLLSDDIGAIGIYSDVSYLVYSKDIIGINNVLYMNLFDGILK